MKPMTAEQALLAFDRIDIERETSITGSFFKKDDQLGFISTTNKDAILHIFPEMTPSFMQAIKQSSLGDYIGRHIQCINQNKNGERLLTSFVDFIIFTKVDFSGESEQVKGVIQRILAFESLKVDELSFTWLEKK